MAFDWGGAAGGAGSGAVAGSMFGPWGTAIGAVGGGLIGGFMSGDESQEQLGGAYQMSPQQIALLENQLKFSNMGVRGGQALEDFYKTGNWFDMYQAGEAYGKPTGAYDMTQTEKNSQLMLNNMQQQGAPELNRLAWDEYKNLLTTDQYDPMSHANKENIFNPYMDEIREQQRIESDRLNKQMAMGGDFYSTNRSNQQRQLGVDTQRQTNTLLADLYNKYEQQRLSGAKTASDIGAQQQNMQLQQIQAGHQYGALQRTLDDQKAKEQYNEWLRGRSEYGDLINSAKLLYSGGIGVPFNAPQSNAYYMQRYQPNQPSAGSILGTELIGGVTDIGMNMLKEYIIG